MASGNLLAGTQGQKCDLKAQPWKQHWPPRTEATAGEKHGSQKGAVLELDGGNGYIARLTTQ